MQFKSLWIEECLYACWRGFGDLFEYVTKYSLESFFVKFLTKLIKKPHSIYLAILVRDVVELTRYTISRVWAQRRYISLQN